MNLFEELPVVHSIFFKSKITKAVANKNVLVSSDNSKTNIKSYQNSKVYAFIEYLNNNFKNFYLLNYNIAIDESLIVLKDGRSFMQYTPPKSTKFRR
jgi:hypothetical protein